MVNHFISGWQDPEDALAMSSTQCEHTQRAVCCKGDTLMHMKTPLAQWTSSTLGRTDGFDFVDANRMLRQEDKNCRTN